MHGKLALASIIKNPSRMCEKTIVWPMKKLVSLTCLTYIFVMINYLRFLFILQPFGKRSGHKKDNRVLYKEVLLELGRVVRPNSGRAVLLTHDRRTFTRVSITDVYSIILNGFQNIISIRIIC